MTLKQKQSIIPSKSMAIEEAEDFVRTAREKIKKLKETASKGGVDEQLELALKENKYL